MLLQAAPQLSPDLPPPPPSSPPASLPDSICRGETRLETERGGFTGPHCLDHGRWVRARQPFIISSKLRFLLGRGHCSSLGTLESPAFQEKHQGNLGSPRLADITHLDLIQSQVPQKQKPLDLKGLPFFQPEYLSKMIFLMREISLC